MRLWEDAAQVCARAGRDFVRALQDVARHPIVERIWLSILSAQGPVSLEALLLRKCPARILASRLSPEMEKQMLFLLKEVKEGAQARHERWFADLHLESPMSDTLVCDLIRFVIVAYVFSSFVSD